MSTILVVITCLTPGLQAASWLFLSAQNQTLGHHYYTACFRPLVQQKLMQEGGDHYLLVIHLTSQFNFLTALLEYLDLEGARLRSLFSKSEETPTS